MVKRSCACGLGSNTPVGKVADSIILAYYDILRTWKIVNPSHVIYEM